MDPAMIYYVMPVITILGAGFSAFLGVKIALAEMRGDLKRHEDQLKSHGSRLDRLEKPFFMQEGGG